MPPRLRVSTFAVALATILVLSPTAANADWLPNGNPVTSSIELQFFPRLASDGNRGAFVAWENPFTSVQHFTATGERERGWPGSGITYGVGHQAVEDQLSVLVPDGQGGAYAIRYVKGEYCQAHCNQDPSRLWVERFTASGSIARGWPVGGVLLDENGVGRAYPPSVAPDGHHGVLIAWTSYVLRAQRIGSDGRARWGKNGLAICELSAERSHPTIVDNGAGGALVFWGDHRAGRASSLMYGQHVSATGALLWARDGVQLSLTQVDVPGFIEGPPMAVPDNDGGAILGWAGVRDGGFGIWAARITRRGEHPWGRDVPLSTAPGDKTWCRMISSGRGGATVAWVDSRRSPSGDVYAQRITHGGRVQWKVDGTPVCTAAGTRGPLALADDGHDGDYIAWGDSRPQGELFATRLIGTGAPARGWPSDGALVCGLVPILDPIDRQVGSLDIAATGGGRAIVAWQDMRKTPTPSGFDTLDVEQSAVTMLTPDGPAAAPSGTPAVTPNTGPVASLGPPSARAPFALRGMRPNPAVGGGSLAFALPEALPATLELFDVTGRRRWSREVGDLGPGEHAVRLGDGARFPPGLYLARLRQGRHTASSRVVIVR